MIHFCTHFDSTYFAHGMALISSLRRHCELFELGILALDKECELRLEQTNRFEFDTTKGNVTVIGLTQFEENFQQYDLSSHRYRHAWKEYCWLLEPLLCKRMLQYDDFDSFCYVDSDSFFFAPLQPVIDAIPGDALVALAPHRFPPKFSERERTVGRFNFGFGWFRNCDEVRELVDRWVELTLDRCDDNAAGGQRYLDDWPAILKGRLHELPATVNVGPWQLPEIVGDPPKIGGEPLVHYHFHELRRRERGGRNPTEIVGERWNLTDYKITESTQRAVYRLYLLKLASIIAGLDEKYSELERRRTDPDCRLYDGTCDCESLWLCEKYDPLENE